MTTDDSQLLASYARDRDAGAFQQLVERHINFVYAAALRQTRNPHMAQDVTQAVFLLLSQRASRLNPGVVVKGWLFNATRYVVANARRAEARRKFHEREAAAMRTEIVRENPDSGISLHLDDAMAGLSKKNRRVLLLRFFEGLPLEAVGRTLDISQNAAQKRLTRALDRVLRFLIKRGAAIPDNSLDGIFQANAAHAAPAFLAKATIDLALHGASNAANSSSAISLAKGAAKMMIRAKAKLLAIPCAIAGASIGAVAVLAASQPRLVPPSPAQSVVVAMADVAESPDALGKNYDACHKVLESIIDGYDRNEPAAVESFFYYKPQTDPKIVDVLDRILDLDVADYRLTSAAASRFGMHGTMLLTNLSTDAVTILDVLSRITPQNARLVGDTLTITPAPTTGPNAWPDKPFYFVRAQGVWKLDAGRTFRVTFHASRRRPVAGESSQQVFAAEIHLLVGQFNAIADDIDKGNIPDEAETQRRVVAAYEDLDAQFSDIACNTNPR